MPNITFETPRIGRILAARPTICEDDIQCALVDLRQGQEKLKASLLAAFNKALD